MRTLLCLLAVALFAGCGGAPKCGPSSCSGCCDAAGACKSGGDTTACGTGGLLCGSCQPGLSCNLGQCSSAGTGGGTSSGGGSGVTGGGGGTTGGGGGTTGGGSGSAYETWCPSYLTSACDFEVRCGLFSSVSGCRGAVGVYVPCATTPAMRDNRTVFDSAAAASCISQLGSTSCESYDLAPCLSASHGAGTLNAPCYGYNECTADLYCDLSSTCPGLCHPTTPLGQTTPASVPCAPGTSAYGGVCLGLVPLGQSCAPSGGQTSDRTCVAAAFCSSQKLCTAKRTSGQSCTTGSYGECAGILQCSGGTCGPWGSVNAPCDSTRRCKADLTCSAANVCVTLGGINTACTSSYGQCQADLFCEIPAGLTTGLCKVPRTLGQACTYTGYECGTAIYNAAIYCTATSTQTTGVCALKKGAGAPCQDYSECTSSVCSSSVCGGTTCVDPTP